MEYIPTIGLEIHAELKTKTKMFCACLNDPDEVVANTNICPVCMAHPGSLPVINREAVHKVLRMGTAIGGTLADFTEFDRKNYFYPDIPKGYQISQYKFPLISGGVLGGVAITRIHLEEDTARSQHLGERSLVDYNRAGVPLMELVTEPVIHDAETAGAFARELQLLLRYLGAGEANMEKGEMRVEANISVSKDSTLGTKVEVKNINSFRAVERTIVYEVARQINVLEKGGSVVQETRGWDDTKQETFSQRKKESSHDYRYFPDPDLPKLVLSDISAFSQTQLLKDMPELPVVRRARYVNLGLKAEDASMFVRDTRFGNFIDMVITRAKENVGDISRVANYLASDIAGALDAGKVQDLWLADDANATRMIELARLSSEGLLSSRGVKDTLAFMFTSTESAKKIAESNNLIQQSDEGFLTEVARRVVAAHPQVATDYKAGKGAALQFLVGQGMKETKGAANPGVLAQHIQKALQ